MIYKFNKIKVKITIGLCDNNKTVLKFILKFKRTRIVKTFFKKKRWEDLIY